MEYTLLASWYAKDVNPVWLSHIKSQTVLFVKNLITAELFTVIRFGSIVSLKPYSIISAFNVLVHKNIKDRVIIDHNDQMKRPRDPRDATLLNTSRMTDHRSDKSTNF